MALDNSHVVVSVHPLSFPDKIPCVESFVGSAGGAFTLNFPQAGVLC